MFGIMSGSQSVAEQLSQELRNKQNFTISMHVEVP